MDNDQRRRVVVVIVALAFALVASLGACDSNAHGLADAHPPSTDANADCLASPTLTIGGCQLLGTTEPCTGVAGEQVEFVPIPDGGSIKMVIGPQGLTMFILGIRTSGIDPGDPSNVISQDNPSIDISLLGNGGEMGRYRARTPFSVANDPLVEANGLFVVVEGQPSDFDGFAVSAYANVVDKNGVTRCGGLQFVAAQ